MLTATQVGKKAKGRKKCALKKGSPECMRRKKTGNSPGCKRCKKKPDH